MSVVIHVSLTEQSKRVLEQHARRPSRVVASLNKALEQGLSETATHLIVDKLSATFRKGQKRGGQAPLAVRTGALRQSVRHERDAELSGYVGVVEGPTTNYAKVHLLDGTTVITPKKSKFLWIPLDDNMTSSGVPRLSPTAARAMVDEKGNPLLRYVKSPEGGLIAGVDGGRGNVPGVRRTKKFTALFALVKSVTIQGTGALAKAVEERTDRIRDLLQAALTSGLESPGTGGST